MKFIYFGCDSLLSCLFQIIKHGHTIEKIYTSKKIVCNQNILRAAAQKKIKVSKEKPTIEELEQLVKDGAECFFAGEYPYKIPVPKNLKYAINVHPSLLPEGRGCTPISEILLKQKTAGITIHKLAEEYDTGDILLQKQILLSESESFDTLSAKIYLEAGALMEPLLNNFEQIYAQAEKQTTGSYWPKLEKEHQTIDWNQTTKDILKIARAFGTLGSYANIAGTQVLITNAEGICYKTSFAPGEVLLNDATKIVIASKDGMISIPKTCLYEMA